MSALTKLVTVVGKGAVLNRAEVPAGRAMGMHQVAAATATCAGSLTVVLAVVSIGEPARAWLMRWLGPKFEARVGELAASDREGGEPDAKRSVIVRVWDRYGFIGLALISPLFPGPAGAAALALALGIPGRRVLLWESIGVILWTTGFTIAVSLGFRGLSQVIG